MCDIVVECITEKEENKMKKYKTATTIELARGNHAKSPIYEHEGKYYIKANKPNTSAYSPFRFDGTEYSEVKEIGGWWFTV